MGHVYVYGITGRQWFKLGFTEKSPLHRGREFRKSFDGDDVDFLVSVFADGNAEDHVLRHWRSRGAHIETVKGDEFFDASHAELRGWVRWLRHRTFANLCESEENPIRVSFGAWGPNDDRIEACAPYSGPYGQMALAADGLREVERGPWDDILRSPPITENDWYTPRPITDLVRRVMGGVDTDPASHPEANQYICAKRIYTQEDNGLEQPWHGRVFCNPPFSPGSLVTSFAKKAISEYFFTKNCTEMMFLLGTRKISAKYISEIILSCDAMWLSHGRLSFEGRLARDSAANSSADGTVIFYFGPHTEKFNDAFSQIGYVFFGNGRRTLFAGNSRWNRTLVSDLDDME